jgi:hypothetical protein
MKKTRISGRKLLRLPLSFWTLVTVCALVGIVTGAVIFSARFGAHVNIIAVGPNLRIYDAHTGLNLATNVAPNLNTLEFGTIGLGNAVRHTIHIYNDGPRGSTTFYIRLPGSFAANPDGPSLPGGVTVMLDIAQGYSCASWGGSFNPDGTVCSIPVSPTGGPFTQVVYLDVILTVALTAVPQDLTFSITISAFDIQF